MGGGASNNYKSYGRGGPPNRKGGGYTPNQPLPSNVKGGGDGYPRTAVLPDDYVAPLRPPKAFKDPNYGDPRDRGYPLPRRFERPSAPTPMPPPGQEPMNTYGSGKGGALGEPREGMDTGGRRYRGDTGVRRDMRFDPNLYQRDARGRIANDGGDTFVRRDNRFDPEMDARDRRDNRFTPVPAAPVISGLEGLRGFASRFQPEPERVPNPGFNTRNPFQPQPFPIQDQLNPRNPLTRIDSRMDRTQRSIQRMQERGLPIPARLKRRMRKLQSRQAMERRRLQRMMELRNRASQPAQRVPFRSALSTGLMDPRLRQTIGRSAFMDPRFR